MIIQKIYLSLHHYDLAMSTKQQVKEFLKELLIKMKLWDILFLDGREKNSQTLADLELMPNERKKIIEKLEVDDYL